MLRSRSLKRGCRKTASFFLNKANKNANNYCNYKDEKENHIDRCLMVILNYFGISTVVNVTCNTFLYFKAVDYI
jgi:hypothetical protein